MNTYRSVVTKADKIRCRPEDEGKHLLYNARTDQLHILDDRGKQIFDFCDGRSIDEVVRQGASLLTEAPSDASRNEVLAFLCELHKRDLVVMC